jgi:hypothetical protein
MVMSTVVAEKGCCWLQRDHLSVGSTLSQQAAPPLLPLWQRARVVVVVVVV